MDDEIDFLGSDYSTNSPNLTSSSNQLPSATASVILVTLFILFNVSAIVGNLLILKVVPKIPHDAIGDTSKVFYIGQAVTDAVAALMYITAPISGAVAEWAGWTNGRLAFCRVVGFLISSSPGISILQIALLNTDRYLFIVKPMFYLRFVSRKLAEAASVGVAVFAVTLLLLFICFNKISFDILRYYSHVKTFIVAFEDESFLTFSLCTLGISWLVMLCLIFQYCHIFKISTNHWNRINPRSSRTKEIAVQPCPSRPSDSASSSTSDLMNRSKEQNYKGCTYDYPEETLAYGEKLGHTGIRESPQDRHVKIVVTQSVVELDRSRNSFDRHGRGITEQLELEQLEENASEQNGAAEPSKRGDDIQTINSSPQGLFGSMDKRLPAELTSGWRSCRYPLRHLKQSTLRQNLRVLRTPLIITSCFFVSFLPPTFLNIYLAVTGVTVDPFLHTALTTIVAFNGGVNIVVYYITIKPFRQYLRSMFRRQ